MQTASTARGFCGHERQSLLDQLCNPRNGETSERRVDKGLGDVTGTRTSQNGFLHLSARRPCPIVEDIKHVAEVLTGLGRPARRNILLRNRKPHPYQFRDDGETPNNPRCPLILYRSPVVLDTRSDPSAIFEVLFDTNGWRDSWRDGMYDFLHFHTSTHEALGIARGWVRAKFGGSKGRTIELRRGDVVIVPAGTGHCRKAASQDLLVVGAYPSEGAYDEPKPSEIDSQTARSSIAKVPIPQRDPVYGKEGPLVRLWRKRR